MLAMALSILQAHLEKNFHASAAAAIDATLRLSVAEDSLAFRISHGTLEFVDGASCDGASCDATFYFHDVDSALALLSGQADPFEAFMNGGFRADGYLMWAFTLMAMFRTASLPPPA
jgi:putative sterol carrier protein